MLTSRQKEETQNIINRSIADANELDLRIKVMRASIEGKPIECRGLFGSEWTYTHTPAWSWGTFQYRVKKEPRKFKLAVNKSGAVIGNLTRNDTHYFVQRGYEIIEVVEVIKE